MRLIDADLIKYHRTTECGGHGVFLDVDMVYKEEIDAISTIDPESLRPQWIPVTQRLPDAEEEVLAFCKCGKGGYVCEAFFIPKGTYREESGYCFEWECCKEYNEERDDYEINPGWYERIYNWDEYGCVAIHDMVTHWMPIPKAPESDGDADDLR